MKRSAIGDMLRRFVGRCKPRPVCHGGHPTIPWGKIIAKPRSDGGYSLSVYRGIGIGWVRAGEVSPAQDVQEAMRNLARPVETYAPIAEVETFSSFSVILSCIDSILTEIDRTYACVCEHGDRGLASIDNLCLVVKDAKSAVQDAKDKIQKMNGEN